MHIIVSKAQNQKAEKRGEVRFVVLSRSGGRVVSTSDRYARGLPSNLASNLCWSAHMWKPFPAMLAMTRSAGVALEMNLREHISCMPLPSANKAAHSGLETQKRHHQKSKTGVSVAPQKDLCPPNFFFKKKELLFFIPCHSWRLQHCVRNRLSVIQLHWSWELIKSTNQDQNARTTTTTAWFRLPRPFIVTLLNIVLELAHRKHWWKTVLSRL